MALPMAHRRIFSPRRHACAATSYHRHTPNICIWGHRLIDQKISRIVHKEGARTLPELMPYSTSLPRANNVAPLGDLLPHPASIYHRILSSHPNGTISPKIPLTPPKSRKSRNGFPRIMRPSPRQSFLYSRISRCSHLVGGGRNPPRRAYSSADKRISSVVKRRQKRQTTCTKRGG